MNQRDQGKRFPSIGQQISMPGGDPTLPLYHSNSVTTGCHPVTLLSPWVSTLPLNYFAPKKRLEARNIEGTEKVSSETCTDFFM